MSDEPKVTLFPDGTIRTRPKTKEYEEGWDRIFKNPYDLEQDVKEQEQSLLESMETHDWVPGYGWVLKELRKDK